MFSTSKFTNNSDDQWLSKPKNTNNEPKKVFGEPKILNPVKRSQGGGDEDEITYIGTKSKAAVETPGNELDQGSQQVEGPPSYKRKVIHSDLWKVFKGKYLLGFYLCQNCWSKVYGNKDKLLILETGRVMLTFDMCEDCAYMNCRGADFLAPPKPKKVKTELM